MNGYFYTADDSTDVLLRTRHEHDDAAPSASAQILEALAPTGLDRQRRGTGPAHP